MSKARDNITLSITINRSNLPGSRWVLRPVRRATLGTIITAWRRIEQRHDRDGEMLKLEADHRRHAEVENAIRDLKYGVGLNHMPSGRFAANGAWLAIQVMAHNLALWTARIGLGEQIVM